MNAGVDSAIHQTAQSNRLESASQESDLCTSSLCGEVQAVDVRELAPGTEITVGTSHSTYQLIVLDGAPGVVMMQGGRIFLEPTEAGIDGYRGEDDRRVDGSIKVGVGFEFTAWQQRGRTSPVRKIVVSACPPCREANPAEAGFHDRQISELAAVS